MSIELGWLRLVVAGSVFAMGVAGCAGSSSSRPGGTPAGHRTMTVSAAASLTGTFDQLAEQFEADNPGVTVKMNYGASPDLAQQVVAGARVDVFASASPSTMGTVSRAGLVDGTPMVFVTNKLQIAVAKGNPKTINSFADLARPGVAVVVAGPQEPCGAATQKVEQATRAILHPVSEERPQSAEPGGLRHAVAPTAVSWWTVHRVGSVVRPTPPHTRSAALGSPNAMSLHAQSLCRFRSNPA